jgi:hypothetical protein
MTTVRDCDYPWTGFMIWAKGVASCCCYGSSPVGDVTATAPEAVWNNATMQSLRASLAAGVLHTVCQSGTCKYVVGSRASQTTPAVAAASADFDETWYVTHYFDVREGVGRGLWLNGRDHYRRFGHREFRCTNGREWREWVRQQQERAQAIGTGYSATLSWERGARLDERTIAMSFSAANSGSIPWRPRGVGSTSIRGSADAYRRLDDVYRVNPMYSYRADLHGVVEPGQSISLEIEAPLDHFPIGRSFVVLDLVSDENRVRITDAATKPLVLGVHRDELTDRVDLLAS